MGTTTIRLSDELKARIDRLAAASGKSAHAFMVDALSESAALMERQQAFDAEVEKRWRKYQRGSEHFLHEDVIAYAKALAAGHKPALPEARRIGSKQRAAGRA